MLHAKLHQEPLIQLYPELWMVSSVLNFPMEELRTVTVTFWSFVYRVFIVLFSMPGTPACSPYNISSPGPVFYGTKWLPWHPHKYGPKLHLRCRINKGLIKRGSTIDLQRSWCKGWFLWPIPYTYIGTPAAADHSHQGHPCFDYNNTTWIVFHSPLLWSAHIYITRV
jgi:hypothetical protein